MVRSGARNLITDVAGLRVGHAEDHRVRPGVAVVVGDTLTTAVVDIRGGAPGTRDTEALDPIAIDGGCDAIVLSGGSVYGLGAPAGGGARVPAACACPSCRARSCSTWSMAATRTGAPRRRTARSAARRRRT